MTAWTDQFVGDRMAVDREFTERVAASEFSSQEWGTIMTAVEFDIEDPESPEEARVIGDTSKIDQVLPALEQMRSEAAFGGVPGGGDGDRGAGGSSEGGGLFGSIKDSLGLGGEDETEHRAEAAEALVEEYARQFQAHLEDHGKWEDACAVAAATADQDRGEDGLDAAAERSDEERQSSPE